MGMIQGGECFCFALETRATVRIRDEQLGQHLDRDVAIELCIPGAIDLAHPARAESRENLVGAKVSAGCQRHASRLILAMKGLAAKARRRDALRVNCL